MTSKIEIKTGADENIDSIRPEIQQSKLFNDIFVRLQSWPGWKVLGKTGINQDMSAITHCSRDRPLRLRHVPNRDLHQVESQRNCHMTILSLLGLDLEQQFASVGIAFHTLMRERCLLQWQRLGDSNVDLACHEEINDPPRGRDKMPGIVLSEVAETVALMD